MEISRLQLEQVNHQIHRLIASENFYGKKLKEAGVTGVSSAWPRSAARATAPPAPVGL